MQNILVTGASRGIGLGLVRHSLESTPYFVIATCRRPAEASDLQELTQQYGAARLLVMQLDTTSAASHAACQVQLAEKGIGKIDALIANAGIASSKDPNDSFLSSDEGDMMNVFNTNVVGTMQTVQSCHALVAGSAAKLCVVVSSRLGSISYAGSGYCSYRASKAAVNMMAMSYAKEPAVVAAGAKVLCVHPGWVQTDMGETGGRKAPVTVRDSAKGIVQLIQAAACVQMGTDIPAQASPSLDGFVEAMRAQPCVFVAYDGELLPW